MIVEQMEWDFSDLVEKPAYSGRAPVGFTTDYFTLAELSEAWDEYIDRHGNFDSYSRSHMWRGSMTGGSAGGNGHTIAVVTTSLECKHYGIECYCVKVRLAQAICEPCAWHIVGDETEVVTGWHDHAWPGWRELPVLGQVQSGYDRKPVLTRLIAAVDYPSAWMVAGVPIITTRDQSGTRCVPGYSPWGGYDISSTALVAA